MSTTLHKVAVSFFETLHLLEVSVRRISLYASLFSNFRIKVTRCLASLHFPLFIVVRLWTGN